MHSDLPKEDMNMNIFPRTEARFLS